MALQSQAQLLDELMGKNRNAGPGIRINSIKFDDEDVCKWSLCGFCPHDLFVNTRADLGPCDKIHDDELVAAYEKSSRNGRLGYEDDFERFIRSLLMDVEKKIKRGIERLKLTQNDPNHKSPSQLRDEKIALLKSQINAIIKEAESLGELGEIDQAQAKLESCDKLKSECKYLENQAEQNGQLIDQKIMEVCEVCGSFLIVNDAQARIEEHVAGKQHMGYAKLRQALEDIRKKRIVDAEKKEKERQARREERDRGDRLREHDRREDRSHRHRDSEKEKERSVVKRTNGGSELKYRSSKSPSRVSRHGNSSRRSRSRSRDRERRSEKRRRSRTRSRESKQRRNGEVKAVKTAVAEGGNDSDAKEEGEIKEGV